MSSTRPISHREAGLLRPEELSALHDPARLAALNDTRLLDTPPEEAFDRLTLLASELTRSPLALVNLVDDRRQFAKSCFAPVDWAGERDAPLRDSFCKWAVVEREPIVVSDAREDPRVARSSMIAELGIRSYLGIPLATREGHVLGSLCVVDFEARAWGEREVRLLGSLAASVMTEIELRAELARQREIERLKDEFVGVVSHELRTPLTSIRGSLGLLASGRLGDLSPQGVRMVEIAAQNVDRLVRIINDMLNLERLESGSFDPESATIPASDVVEQALDGLRSLASGSGVELRADVAPALEVWADRDAVLQVLTNLVGNAIKFSPASGVVEVVAERVGSEIQFQVRDQGRGIPQSMLETVFERFRQVDGSDARQKGGTGLGLPISRSIVLKHGGRIWVTSEENAGSTFFFTLPVSAPAPPAEAAPAPTASSRG